MLNLLIYKPSIRCRFLVLISYTSNWILIAWKLLGCFKGGVHNPFAIRVRAPSIYGAFTIYNAIRASDSSTRIYGRWRVKGRLKREERRESERQSEKVGIHWRNELHVTAVAADRLFITNFLLFPLACINELVCWEIDLNQPLRIILITY